jgi:hypothetical protein
MVTQLVPGNNEFSFENDAELAAPFSPQSKLFIEDLSRALLSCRSSQYYSDIAALGFWFRKAHVEQLEQVFLSSTQGRIYKPCGTVFQVSPGNVEALFLYSGLLSLLMGNRTITRVSSGSGALFAELQEILNSVFASPEHTSVAQRFSVINFAHDSGDFEKLSKSCDVRILWGSDATIKQLRQKPLQAHTKEITFASKTSLALIRVSWLKQLSEDVDAYNAFIANFCKDAFSFNQQACSSSRGVVWIDSDNLTATEKEAKDKFWADIDSYRSSHFDQYTASQRLNRVGARQALAAAGLNFFLVNDFLSIDRMQTDRLGGQLHEYHSGCGLFFEISVSSLAEFAEHLQQDSKFQTLSYAGLSKKELSQWLSGLVAPVFDRVVPVGRSLEFDVVWDGYNLMNEMTKCVSIY